MESLNEFNKEVMAEVVSVFIKSLGINAVTVTLGNMGSSQRFDYTCFGSRVNMAPQFK
jgi:class 3 adenylate cyclase